MPFPNKDAYWNSAAAFVRLNYTEGELVLAPDEFIERFASMHSYAETFGPKEFVYQWIVIHKGMLGRINKAFLSDPRKMGKPVFGNEVFVVFSPMKKLYGIDTKSYHFRSFSELLAKLKDNSPASK